MNSRSIRNAIRAIASHPSNRGRRVAVARQAFSYRLRTRGGREAQLPLGESLTVQASRSSASMNLLSYGNPPDHQEWALWSRILVACDVFVDVGANIGMYSLLAAERGCRVVSYEPDATNLRLFGRNIVMNHLDIDIRDVAVSDHAGTVTFMDGADSQGSVIEDMDIGHQGVAVIATTLDIDLSDIPRIRGVKIDVEGHEAAVLRGAIRLLREQRIDVIQIEWNELRSSREDEFHLLKECGYMVLRPDRDGFLKPADFKPGPDVFAMTPAFLEEFEINR